MTRRGLARAISIALHPLAVLIVATGAATRRLPAVVAVAVIVAIPLVVFMIREVRAGRWENVDASRPAERPRMFAVSLAVMAILAIVFLRDPSLAPFARGIVVTAVLFVIAWVLLRWIKLSLHVAVATMAAISLIPSAPLLAIALGALVPLLAWARVTMERHTIAEITLGAVLGGIAGVVLLV